MTITSTRPTETAQQTRGRVAAAASLGFAFCLFWTVAVMNVPHDATDAELIDWWQDSGNRFTGIASSFFAVGAAVLLAVVVDHIRRIPAAANAPAWLGFARSMGAAFTATLLVSAALRGVIGLQVDTLDGPVPSIDVLRYSTSLNYYLISLSVMGSLALTILAVSMVSVRTGALPRWTAYVGFGAALVILGAVSVQMGAYAIVFALFWAACLSIALWREGSTEGALR